MMEENSSNKGRLALERNLQKAFRSVQSFYLPLQTVLTETVPTVKSLSNMLEQLECCRSLESCSPALTVNSFPEVKSLLIKKLEDEIHGKQEELETKITFLKEKEEIVTKLCDSSAGLLEKYSSSLDCNAVCAASPTSPSVADMVDWLGNIDHLLHEQYYCKLHLLENALHGQEVNSQNFVQLWTDQDGAMLDTIKDYLLRAEHFLGEKR